MLTAVLEVSRATVLSAGVKAEARGVDSKPLTLAAGAGLVARERAGRREESKRRPQSMSRILAAACSFIEAGMAL